MPRNSQLTCSVCQKQRSEISKLYRCSSCWTRIYCGQECQKSDWRTHKPNCSSRKWYDRYRKCQDGSYHGGDLELITWDCPKEETGWGHVLKNEEADLKRKFEVEFGGNLQRLHKYWPQAFRWTCCGTDAGMDWGCDHHGTGSEPCTCDFCKMGKRLPSRIYHEQSASRMGLRLPRGPDPRSYDPAGSVQAKVGRSMFGLEM